MPKVKIRTRTIPNTVKLSHSQFVRFVAQRFGVSQVAISQAMKIIIKGIKLALSEGHTVMWEGLCVYDVREIGERARFNPKSHQREIHAPSCRVHIRPSSTLTRDVVAMSRERLESFAKEHPIKDAKKK